MSLMPYFIIWSVLAVVVIVLALMRRNVSEHEDDSIHLAGGEAAANEQAMIAKKLTAIDKWGNLLTIILVATGLVLAVLYGLQVWDETSRVGLK